jgi:hypothetical protein
MHITFVDLGITRVRQDLVDAPSGHDVATQEEGDQVGAFRSLGRFLISLVHSRNTSPSSIIIIRKRIENVLAVRGLGRFKDETKKSF